MSSSIPEAKLDSIATSMIAAAAQVLAALVDRNVNPGSASSSTSEASLRVEDETVATFTDLPALSAGFIVRYAKSELAKIVGLMVGSENDGEMDAMQLSIVSETVAQISSAMGEQLVQAVGLSTDGIASHVVGETTSFPAPPFTTYKAQLEIAEEFPVSVEIDFDGVALSKLASEERPAASAAAETPAKPSPEPAPARQPAAPQAPPTSARRPAAAAQPAAFAPMQLTGVQTAAPGHSNLDLVHDIPLQISAVLGQTALALRDVVAMQAGSVFELDKLSTDPIDLYVNNILIARGEVVVVDDKYAVKISELNPLQHERV